MNKWNAIPTHAMLTSKSHLTSAMLTCRLTRGGKQSWWANQQRGWAHGLPHQQISLNAMDLDVYLATAAIVALMWNWLEIRSPFGCYTKLPCTGRFWLVLANLIVLCERINWNKLKQARQIELNSLKNVVNNGKNSHFGPSIIITRDSVLSLNF